MNGIDRDSTRSGLFFFSHFISCKSLNLSESTATQLKCNGGPINTCLENHGENVTKYCILCLAGINSVSQILWSCMSESIFTILSRIDEYRLGSVESQVGRRWIWEALSGRNDHERFDDETIHIFIQVLFGLLKEKGQKSKPMVKMLLLDFAKICKGEGGRENLLSYGINVNA